MRFTQKQLKAHYKYIIMDKGYNIGENLSFSDKIGYVVFNGFKCGVYRITSDIVVVSGNHAQGRAFDEVEYSQYMLNCILDLDNNNINNWNLRHFYRSIITKVFCIKMLGFYTIFNINLSFTEYDNYTQFILSYDKSMYNQFKVINAFYTSKSFVTMHTDFDFDDKKRCRYIDINDIELY